MWCVLSACPLRRIVHTKTVLLFQDFAFVLWGQTADQRLSLLGKRHMLKLSEGHQAGGIPCEVPIRLDFHL